MRRDLPGVAGYAAICAMLAVLLTVSTAEPARAHPPTGTPTAAAGAFLAGLAADRRSEAARPFDDPERFAFTWLPGRRGGLTLDRLSAPDRARLKETLHQVLSHAGEVRVDAILATEAALGVLEGNPRYRDPGKYTLAVFGTPAASGRWAMRFEGHHLSVNITFDGDRIVSATPLFLGANSETITAGPDRGLRAVGKQVDLARKALLALTPAQRATAEGGGEWFKGFLTSPGSRRAALGRSAGVDVTTASSAAQGYLKELLADYVGTITETFAGRYLDWIAGEEWPHLKFFWSGGSQPGDTYYWRLQGRRLLIEHDGQAGGTHIHSVWRDAELDFGGPARR